MHNFAFSVMQQRPLTGIEKHWQGDNTRHATFDELLTTDDRDLLAAMKITA